MLEIHPFYGWRGTYLYDKNPNAVVFSGQEVTGLTCVYQAVTEHPDDSSQPNVRKYTYRRISAKSVIKYAKGTTSYGTVTSPSSTAYQSGVRNSDGYWFFSTSPQ